MRFGDSIMIKNKATNGILVFDSGDKITSNDEAYGCTTTDKEMGPCARSIITIARIEDDGSDNVVRYGQKVRLEGNPYLIGKKVYLHSTQISPLSFARFSRNQEVSVIAKPIYNTAWKILHNNPNLRVQSLGQPVPANQEVIIEHCATAQFLFSDKIGYGNDFGVEYEVSVCSNVTANKSQGLALEKIGKMTVEMPTKHALEQNTWTILTAADPSLAEPIAKAAPKYTL